MRLFWKMIKKCLCKCCSTRGFVLHNLTSCILQSLAYLVQWYCDLWGFRSEYRRPVSRDSCADKTFSPGIRRSTRIQFLVSLLINLITMQTIACSSPAGSGWAEQLIHLFRLIDSTHSQDQPPNSWLSHFRNPNNWFQNPSATLFRNNKLKIH